MSDLTQPSYPAPPPPPPPPQPPASQTAAFDFVKPFTFIFQDPRWLPKILIGGLFHIASIFLVGIFFILGYCAKLARNVVGGVEPAAPEWDDVGGYFSEGLTLFAVVFVYALPFVVVACIFFVPAILAGAMAHRDDAADLFANGAASCSMCFIMPMSLAFSLWLPAALMRTAIERRFAAGFEFGRIYEAIRSNLVNYLLAFVVMMVVRFAASFGLIVFCVGIFFTSFWSLIVSTYAFAQASRLSPQR